MNQTWKINNMGYKLPLKQVNSCNVLFIFIYYISSKKKCDGMQIKHITDEYKLKKKKIATLS